MDVTKLNKLIYPGAKQVNNKMAVLLKNLNRITKPAGK